MPAVPENRPLLSHPFRPEGARVLFGRLVLYADRIERRAMGRVQETIPLADLQDVRWRTTDTGADNFSLVLRDGRVLSGRLKGAGLWKAKLGELMAGPRRAPRTPARSKASKPAA